MTGDLLPVTDNESGKRAFLSAMRRPSARMNGLYILLGCSTTLEVLRSGSYRPCMRGFEAVVIKERGHVRRNLESLAPDSNKQTNSSLWVCLTKDSSEVAPYEDLK